MTIIISKKKGIEYVIFNNKLRLKPYEKRRNKN